MGSGDRAPDRQRACRNHLSRRAASVVFHVVAVAEKLRSPIIAVPKLSILGKTGTTGAVEVCQADATNEHSFVGIAAAFVERSGPSKIFFDDGAMLKGVSGIAAGHDLTQFACFVVGLHRGVSVTNARIHRKR